MAFYNHSFHLSIFMYILAAAEFMFTNIVIPFPIFFLGPSELLLID